MSWTQFCLKLFQRNGFFFPFHSFFYISNSIRFRFFFFLSFFGPLFSWHKSSKPNIGNSCLVFNFTRLFVTCKKLFSGSPIGSYGSKTELLQYYSIKQNAAMIVRRFAFFLKVTIWGHTCVLKIQKLGLLYLIACTTHWLHFSSTCTKVSLLFQRESSFLMKAMYKKLISWEIVKDKGTCTMNGIQHRFWSRKLLRGILSH